MTEQRMKLGDVPVGRQIRNLDNKRIYTVFGRGVNRVLVEHEDGGWDAWGLEHECYLLPPELPTPRQDGTVRLGDVPTGVGFEDVRGYPKTVLGAVPGAVVWTAAGGEMGVDGENCRVWLIPSDPRDAVVELARRLVYAGDEASPLIRDLKAALAAVDLEKES